ncbi:hypothetical protein [Fusobacterium sp.]|uniref:hypothetical protein n=1 Tax=Fusobacterium sp. TaxID=68766 RepID=UPI0026374447|nr:hypothetical protein [Fusobacterium sp.]
MAKKGKIEVIKELEYKGIKLGQKIKIGYWADKEEMIIGVDTEDGDFLMTNSGSTHKSGITLKEEIERDGFTGVKILKGYENIDAFEWSWVDKDDFTVIEEE